MLFLQLLQRVPLCGVSDILLHLIGTVSVLTTAVFYRLIVGSRVITVASLPIIHQVLLIVNVQKCYHWREDTKSGQHTMNTTISTALAA